MKFVIIGYGSIGKRHATNVLSLGHEIILLRHSKNGINHEGIREYYSFDDLIAKEGPLDGAIICSPTSEHVHDVKMLVDSNIPFFLEKPPALNLAATVQIKSMLRAKGFSKYDIGFNLRYHPLLRFIKDFLKNVGKIYSANVYVGYFLPYWRKDVDYRATTSAKKELGGGVHIELTHDIDYALWLFGYPEKVTGYVNKISSLEISTEDICSAILKYHDGSVVEVHLDYLSHKYLRGGRIIAEEGTLEWEWDAQSGKVIYYEQNRKVSEEVFVLKPGYDFNGTYKDELDNFIGIIKGTNKSVVDIDTALRSMAVVDAIEISSKEGKWVALDTIAKKTRMRG